MITHLEKHENCWEPDKKNNFYLIKKWILTNFAKISAKFHFTA